VTHSEIVSRLSRLIDNPTTEALYTITMHHVLQQIVNRMGNDAVSLSGEELQLAMIEVQEAINHNLDIREYIDMGLDVWEITRKL